MRKKIRFYKELLVEIIETLCSICLALEKICYRNRLVECNYMADHFKKLKKYSEELRGRE